MEKSMNAKNLMMTALASSAVLTSSMVLASAPALAAYPKQFAPIAVDGCDVVTFQMCSDPGAKQPFLCSGGRYVDKCSELASARARVALQASIDADTAASVSHAARDAPALVTEEQIELGEGIFTETSLPALGLMMEPDEFMYALTPHVLSCQDYTQQAGLTYSNFLITARHFGDAHHKTWSFAFDARHADRGAIGYRALVMPPHKVNESRAGMFLSRFNRARLRDESLQRKQNDFFLAGAALDEFERRHPRVAAKIRAGLGRYTVHNIFEFHFLAGAGLSTTPHEELAFYKTKRDDFRSLHRERARVSGLLAASGLSSAERASLTSSLAALDNALEDAWLEADSLGCLDDRGTNPNKVGPCDWAHEDFTQEVIDYYGSLSASEHRACVEATGDDMANPPSYYKVSSAGNVFMVSGVDVTRNEYAFYNLLRGREQVRDYIDGLVKSGNSAGLPRWAHADVKEESVGDAMFGASWRRETSWGVQRAGSVYDTELAATTGMSADVSVFGGTRRVFDVRADLSTHGGSALRTEVLGMSTAMVRGANTSLAGWDMNIVLDEEPRLHRERELMRYESTFVIAGFPINVAAGAAGKVGVGGRGSARSVSSPKAGPAYSAELIGSYRPYAGLDAFAEGSVGITGLSAGARAELELLSLEQPASFDMSVHADTTDMDTMWIDADNNASIDSTSMSGRFYGFIEYPTGVDVSWDGVRVTYSRSRKTFAHYKGIEESTPTLDSDFRVTAELIDLACGTGGYSCE